MSNVSLDSAPADHHVPTDTLRAALFRLEPLVSIASDWAGNAAFFSDICREAERLHAQLRGHFATSALADSCVCSGGSPELAEERTRLGREYMPILGMLDHILRYRDSIADATPEDAEVWVLRVRELIAVVRRHLAEEDRLLYLSAWRDLGGES